MHAGNCRDRTILLWSSPVSQILNIPRGNRLQKKGPSLPPGIVPSCRAWMVRACRGPLEALSPVCHPEMADSAEMRRSYHEAQQLLDGPSALDPGCSFVRLCGRSGSPTKVHRIQSVVLAAKESKNVEPDDRGISDMVHELIKDKIIA